MQLKRREIQCPECSCSLTVNHQTVARMILERSWHCKFCDFNNHAILYQGVKIPLSEWFSEKSLDELLEGKA